jgi:hypothetical protein
LLGFKVEGKFWKVLFLVATMRFSSCVQLELFKIKLLAILHSCTPSENVLPLSCCYVATLIKYVHAKVWFVTCCCSRIHRMSSSRWSKLHFLYVYLSHLLAKEFVGSCKLCWTLCAFWTCKWGIQHFLSSRLSTRLCGASLCYCC